MGSLIEELGRREAAARAEADRLRAQIAVLTPRAVIANGDFEEYWRFHLECEHQRLYPGVK